MVKTRIPVRQQHSGRLPQAIRDLVGDSDPVEINTGGCADFATILWESNRKLEITSDEDEDGREYSHTFIKHQGRFYDAETPEGIEDWRDFPIYARQHSFSN